MILICAWCKKDMGEKAPLDNKDVTHGICKTCADDLKMKYGMSGVLKPDDILEERAGYTMPNWRRTIHEESVKSEMEKSLDNRKG